MNDLFHMNDTSDVYVKKRYPKYDRLQHYLYSYMYAINDYYRHNHEYVKRPNMLVSLVELLEIDVNDDIIDVYNKLDTTAYYVCNQLGINTFSKHNDKPFKDTIIDDNNEYFLYVNDSFDFYENDYTKDSALKMMGSSITDIFLTHPKKFTNSYLFKDYSVYSINPVMIGVQYYYWYKEQIELLNDADPARFVYEVLLVNVIPSIINRTSINRYIAMVDGDFVNSFTNDNPFNIPSIDKYVTDMYKWYIKDISKHNHMRYDEYLKTLISITGDSFLDIVQMPNIPYSKRNGWIYWLCVLDILNLLLTQVDKKMNMDIITNTTKKLTYNERSKYFDIDNMFTKEILDDKLSRYKNLI